MMNGLTEKQIRLSLPPGASGRKLDDATTHKLSHCMKAVDFIIELADKIVFVEVKDPSDVPVAHANQTAEYVRKFLSGTIDTDFYYKCRDSFLYEWLAGRIGKPVYYYVLIAVENLTEADLVLRSDALKRNLPTRPPDGIAWTNSFVKDCMVFNIATWNRYLPQFAVARI